MDCLIGLVGKDFALVAADTQAARSIVVMKHDQQKVFALSRHILQAVSGDWADCVNFSEFVEKNTRLYEIRQGIALQPAAAASWTRTALADALRSNRPYQVNLLQVGYDTVENVPTLYFMDYLASKVAVPFAAHGYGSYFALSLLDRHYRPDMDEAEALALLRRCIEQIQKRLVINLSKFDIRLVNRDGIRVIEA